MKLTIGMSGRIQNMSNLKAEYARITLPLDLSVIKEINNSSKTAAKEKYFFLFSSTYVPSQPRFCFIPLPFDEFDSYYLLITVDTFYQNDTVKFNLEQAKAIYFRRATPGILVEGTFEFIQGEFIIDSINVDTVCGYISFKTSPKVIFFHDAPANFYNYIDGEIEFRAIPVTKEKLFSHFNNISLPGAGKLLAEFLFLQE